MNRFGWVAAGLVIALLMGATKARAASLIDGTVEDARLCSEPTCTAIDLSLTDAGPVTGTLTLNVSTLQLEFDLTLTSATLAGGLVGSITTVTLQDVRYQGTGVVSLLPGPDEIYSITGGSASITGTSLLNGGSPSDIPVQSLAVSGDCRTAGSGYQCRPMFGPFALVFPEVPRYVSTTLNVVTPEPASLALLGVGLAALASLRSRRR
jgi:PEP-CTERM motif-containing protein